MRLSVLLLSISFVLSAAPEQTRVIRNNPLLIRRKRYLAFPMKSNFVITMSAARALRRVPRGWNIVAECDVPFPLPSDTRPFKKLKFGRDIEKREIFGNLGHAMSRIGFNGSACVERLICEAQNYPFSEENSLIKELLSVVFQFPDLDCGEQESACEVSLLEYFLGGMLNN